MPRRVVQFSFVSFFYGGGTSGSTAVLLRGSVVCWYVRTG